jgi:hypothetical protein
MMDGALKLVGGASSIFLPWRQDFVELGGEMPIPLSMLFLRWEWDCARVVVGRMVEAEVDSLSLSSIVMYFPPPRE